MNNTPVLRPSHVDLLEVMGSDLTVVNAARASFAKEVSVFGDREADLIEYLARSFPQHWAPFAHPHVSVR
ncbi:MAG: hypothetical protein EOM24_33435, partial [Chloroflexia bacterium]|nr:hypothetical protein [Chloroflexia bacterium]